jgi:hypothetical protein
MDGLLRRLVPIVAGGLVVVALVLLLPAGLIVGASLLAPYLATGDRALWILAFSVAILAGIIALATVARFFGAQPGADQANRERRLTELATLLRLEDRFAQSNLVDVQHKLQDGGEWVASGPSARDVGPESVDEWQRVTDYIRLFEPIYLLVLDGAVGAEAIRAICGYRIDQVVRNKKIVGRMIGKRDDEPWNHFLKLWQALDPNGYKRWTQFVRLWQVVDSDGFERQVQIS